MCIACAGKQYNGTVSVHAQYRYAMIIVVNPCRDQSVRLNVEEPLLYLVEQNLHLQVGERSKLRDQSVGCSRLSQFETEGSKAMYFQPVEKHESL